MRLLDGESPRGGYLRFCPDCDLYFGTPEAFKAHVAEIARTAEANPEPLRSSLRSNGMGCLLCHKPLDGVRRGAAYCSAKCRKAAGLRRLRNSPYSPAPKAREASGNRPDLGNRVYAALFPEYGLLKVGYSSSPQPLQSAAHRLERRGLVVTRGEAATHKMLWTASGTLKHEAWLHGHLVFIFLPGFPERTRSSEWYDVRGCSEEEILRALTSVYESTPPTVNKGRAALREWGYGLRP